MLLLPEVKNRPLALVRCPDGIHSKCFFQKHLGRSISKDLSRIKITESTGRKEYIVVKTTRDLINLSQMNVIELHCWGSKSPTIEKPDRLVFDLDPSPEVSVDMVIECAKLMRDALSSLNLTSFVKSTGGKGLHVVIPLRGNETWDSVKSFSKKVAQAIVSEDPKKYVIVSTKSKRSGKIFIDYLRNRRGSTFIANY